MISFDTNVVVRLLTNDDPAQARRAARRLESEPVWLCKTVLLETEWVLRYSYNLAPKAIHAAFSKLLGLPDLTVEDAVAVEQAMDWYAAGLDFADAMHLASSPGVSVFCSFDRALSTRALKMGIGTAVEAP